MAVSSFVRTVALRQFVIYNLAVAELIMQRRIIFLDLIINK